MERELAQASPVRLGIAVLVAVASIAFASCGDDDDGGSGNGGSGNGQDLSGQNAVVVTFGGSIGKAIAKAYGDPVAERTGLRVSYEEPTDYAKLQTQVETGNVSWTVIEADPWWAKQNCKKLLEPMAGRVDLTAIDDRFKIEDCGVPGEAFSMQVAYDGKQFGDNPPTSWDDFFDTKAYPGERALWGSYAVNGALEGALLADGVAPTDLYPLDLDRAYAKLDTIRDDIVFYDTQGQIEQMMRDREVAMAVVAGNQVGAAGGYSPIWDQAILSWSDFITPKDGNVEAAKAILAYIATPEAQEDYVNLIPLGGTTKKLVTPTDPDPLFSDWSLPSHLDETIQLDQDYYARKYNEVQASWTEWVSG